MLACATPRSGEVAAPWRDLLRGEFAAWESVPFGGEGAVEWRDDRLLLPTGSPLTGVRWPEGLGVETDYELELVALRRSGTDFFAGLTLPVAGERATVVLGGWGGALCGLSCLDGRDASSNETKRFLGFEPGRAYRLRVRVEDRRLRAWLEGEPLFDVDATGRALSLRTEVLPCAPLGLASYATSAEVLELRWRPLTRRGD